MFQKIVIRLTTKCTPAEGGRWRLGVSQTPDLDDLGGAVLLRKRESMVNSGQWKSDLVGR